MAYNITNKTIQLLNWLVKHNWEIDAITVKKDSLVLFCRIMDTGECVTLTKSAPPAVVIDWINEFVVTKRYREW